MKQASEAQLADRLVLAAIRLTRTLRALNKSSALSGPLISALAVIVYSKKLAARDLARLEDVTPATISRLITQLEAAGLIARAADKGDARVQWIKATPKGQRLIMQGHQRRLGPLAGAIGALSRTERQNLGAAVTLVEALTKAVSGSAD